MRATAALGQDVARPRPEAQTCACRGTPKIDQGAPVLPRKGQEGSIRKADRLFLADVEGLGIALAAALEGRRHGNRAALQLRQPDRRASLGASGFESLVVFSPAVMTIPVAVFAVALMTVTEEGGPFRFGFCFGAAVSGVAAASPGTEPGTVGVCAEMAVTLARRTAQASPAIRG